jgi:hypothetical protein
VIVLRFDFFFLVGGINFVLVLLDSYFFLGEELDSY